MKRIKVMVVDDSAVVRQMVSSLLARDPEVEVLAAVADPVELGPILKKMSHEARRNGGMDSLDLD